MAAEKNDLKEAIALREAGQLLDAARLFQSIVQEDPGNSEAYFQWGLVAAQRENFQNAFALFTKAASLSPERADAHSNIGFVHMRQGRYLKAIESFSKAIEIDPRFINAYINLALSYLETGAIFEAEETMRKALQIKPDFPSACIVMGSVLRATGKAGEGLDYLKKATVQEPGSSEAWLNYAVSNVDLGNREEAITALEKVVALEPGHARAHQMLAMMKSYKAGDPHLKQMVSLYEDLQLGRMDRIYLSFALGYAYEDIGDIGKAFQCFKEANRLYRSTFNYTLETPRRNFADMEKVFTADFIASHEGEGLEDQTPIFIVGMPRSGTSLVEQILACHPEVYGAGERRYLTDVQFEQADLSFENYPHNLATLKAGDLQAIGRAYLEKLRRHAPDAPRITDKLPMNFRHIGIIRLVFPRAKIIHCTRDPMATCLSNFKHMFSGVVPFAYDLQELGTFYRLYSDLMAFWHGLLPGFIHDVSYERLVSDQESETRRLLEFCDLPWTDQCLNFHKAGRAVGTASALQVSQPLYNDALMAWQKYENYLGPLKEALDG